MAKRIYLAHPISTTGESTDSKRIADELRALGFEVYAAAENASINDKSNDPTALDIYRTNTNELWKADILVVNLTGGNQDGTMFELGIVAGLNEYHEKVRAFGGTTPYIPIIAYTSNARVLQPQFHKGAASGSLNQMNLGGAEEWGEFVGDEQAMLDRLKTMG